MPRLAVIGYPVAHSRSPAMQNAALKALGLDDEWSYGAIEVPPEGFEAKVLKLAASGEYAGVNVTVPHKAVALAVADIADEEAHWIGAANTLSFRDGEIVAANTDVEGFYEALPEKFHWDGLEGRRALVLGAGGAARAVIWKLYGAGAKVDVWNRTASRADSVCAELEGNPVPAPVQGAYDLIVNTTAVGLRGEDPFEHLPLSRDRFDPRQVIVDMVYGDRPSQILTAAEAAGAATVDGLEILVQQGARSLEIWTGREPDLDVMRAAAHGR